MTKIYTLAFLFFICSQVQAATWYVRPTSTGTGSGNSCSNAAGASSLQTIINNAAAGDVINLLGGTFTLSASINISKSLTIKGAGMGTTTLTTGASQLGPFTVTASNVTVSDMTLLAFPGDAALCKGFYVYGKTGINFTNIEFTNCPSGQISEVIIVDNLDGATEVTVNGCWFHNNANTNGVTIRRNSSTNALTVNILNSVFASSDNSRSFPTGVYYNQIVGSGSAGVTITIDNCVFSCLTTNARGAAIGLYGGNSTISANCTISDCTFTGNTNTSNTEGGGALYVYRCVTANFSNCIFDDNASTNHGGGACFTDGATVQLVDLNFTNSVFKNNTGLNGAVHMRKPGNTTTFITNFTNCLFHDNTSSGNAGAISSESSTYSVGIANSTFTLNQGVGTTKEAIQNNTGGTMAITNSIIWGNPAAGTTSDELLNTSATGTINNSVFVAANNTGFTGAGNSGTDPVLVNFEPTSGTTAGYRAPASIGGSPGDADNTDEDGCPSRSFSYPTPTPYCILPVNDAGSITSAGGTAIANIAANDNVNGTSVVLSGPGTNSTIATSGSWQAGITLNTSTGAVVVANGTPVGTYTLSYQLCDNVTTPPSCSVASIEVTVTTAMPVVLEYFNAKKSNTVVLLDWTTASEKNNAFFEIQHAADGINWSAIGKIASKNGDSDYRINYTYTHSTPNKGTNYYRLATVDHEEQREYSSIRSITVGHDASAMAVFPNPTYGTIQINSENDISNMNIFDLTGRLVTSYNLSEAVNNYTLDLSNLPKNNYLLQVFFSDGATASKVLQVK
jgi:hypothetical protein